MKYSVQSLIYHFRVVSYQIYGKVLAPVPKNNKVGSMNDLRPVALTSVAFKTCERIVLPQLKSFINDSLDPFQFAYQSNNNNNNNGYF